MNRKICFVSLGSYPLLTSNEHLKYVGGAELKQVIIGRELAKQGYNISFITYDENSEKKIIDEITIIKSFSLSKDTSILKKTLILWKSLKKANADIYFKGSGPEGIIPFFCILHGKKYVKWLTSDRNVQLKQVHSRNTILTKITSYFDIKFAHTIIAQNKFQKESIEKKFKKKCILIHNPTNIPNNNFENKKNKNIVLWVGTIRTIKQPELFLEIAKILPDYKFKMIGGKSDSEPDLYDKIQGKTKGITNLEFLGFIPHHNIQKYYDEAAILINTSLIEGFPNTFLEAWINYTPVISLNVDPDEVIRNEKLGLHSKTFEQIILDIKNLLHNDELREKMGMNARKYVEQNHDAKKIANQFEQLISSF